MILLGRTVNNGPGLSTERLPDRHLPERGVLAQPAQPEPHAPLVWVVRAWGDSFALFGLSPRL